MSKPTCEGIMKPFSMFSGRKIFSEAQNCASAVISIFNRNNSTRFFALSVGHRIRCLLSLIRGKNFFSQKVGVLRMTMNCIWCWGSSFVWRTSSLLLLPDPLSSEVIVHVRVSSMRHIVRFLIYKLFLLVHVKGSTGVCPAFTWTSKVRMTS